jgi:prephenate dehydrogenase
VGRGAWDRSARGLRALGDLAPRLAGTAVVTDVAGLKAALVRHAASLGRGYPGFRYVGAHPMSGSHLRGAEHARADMFESSPCALVATSEGRGEPEARVERFWKALGCQTLWMTAEEHDAHVATTSALPQIVASALAAAVRQQVGGGGPLLAGPGLRDTTRLAGAPPELWAGILTANREAVLAAMRFFGEQCERWEKALRSGQRDAVQRLLEEDRQARWTLFPPAEKDGARAG